MTHNDAVKLVLLVLTSLVLHVGVVLLVRWDVKEAGYVIATSMGVCAPLVWRVLARAVLAVEVRLGWLAAGEAKRWMGEDEQ